MHKLVVVILYDTSQLPPLLGAWHDAGVPGPTILDSAGGHRTRNWLSRVGLSGVNSLFTSTEVQTKTLLVVINDEILLEKAVQAAENVVGGFDHPDKGLLFVLDVPRVEGIMEIPPMNEPPLKKSRANQPIITHETTVADAMQLLNLTPIIMQSSDPLVNVATAMVNEPAVNVACVVNQRNRLVGLIPLLNLANDLLLYVFPEEFLSEATDLNAVLDYAKRGQTQTVADAMIPPVSVKMEDTLRSAFHQMHINRLSGVPVVDENETIVGYINQLELLAIYAKSDETPGVEKE